VVTQEELASLDYLIWHGNGPKAAEQTECNQSTISRRVRRCADVFALSLRRDQGEWVTNSCLLLQMEREIHQLARLLGQHPLRLEGFPSGSDPLLKPPPPGWVIGPRNVIGTSAPLTLLRERVIDAWLTDSADDLPDPPDFPCVVWPLGRQPVTVLAHPNHPLVGHPNVRLQDLHRFPMPILSAEGYPRSHAICGALGLGSLEMAMRRYDPQSWEGQTADAVTLMFCTPLTAWSFPDLVPLDSLSLFSNRLALVCRADVGEHARLQDLHCLLLARLQHLHSRHPQLERLQPLP
jgi:hypothetical protein